MLKEKIIKDLAEITFKAVDLQMKSDEKAVFND
jgi:hypothetical protein